MLYGTFSLHDVKDVEKLCAAVILAVARKYGMPIDGTEKEDILAYLITKCWELSEQWDSEKTPSFSTYAYRLLSLRMLDYLRMNRVDNRYDHRKPDQVSWDDLLVETEIVEDHQADDPIERLDLELLVESLSEDHRWIFRNVALLVYEGYSREEIASRYDKKVSWVTDQMNVLREAMRDAL